VLHCVAVCRRVLQSVAVPGRVLSVMQFGAMCCTVSVMQFVALCCTVLHYVPIRRHSKALQSSPKEHKRETERERYRERAVWGGWQ